jgi:nitrogen fixation/metabolism regulation signal transduction histidine kinase
MPQGYKRSLRNYLLNSSYQLRFTGVIVVISAILTGGLGYLVLHNAHEASRVVQVRAMDPTDELAQQLVQQFAHGDRILMVTLIAFGFILSVVLAAYGIVLTHKVAGPLFKITNHLDKIRDGKLGVVYNLRKGDQLVDFYEHFKQAHAGVVTLEKSDIERLKKTIASAEAAGAGDHASVVALRDMLARKEKSVE